MFHHYYRISVVIFSEVASPEEIKKYTFLEITDSLSASSNTKISVANMIVANNQQEEKEDFPTKKAYSIEVRKH